MEPTAKLKDFRWRELLYLINDLCRTHVVNVPSRLNLSTFLPRLPKVLRCPCVSGLVSLLASPATPGQFLDTDIAEVECLAFGLDADVAAVSVQLFELPGPLAIHIQRERPTTDLHAELDPFVQRHRRRLSGHHGLVAPDEAAKRAAVQVYLPAILGPRLA